MMPPRFIPFRGSASNRVLASVFLLSIVTIVLLQLWRIVISANAIDDAVAKLIVGDEANIPPPQNSVEVALDSLLRNLPPGRVLFRVPKQMRVADEYRIVVRISRDLRSDLADGLSAVGVDEIKVEDLDQVSPFMSAILDGSAFDIRPLSSEDQPIADTEFTQWEWDVTPTKHGSQVLQLRLSLRLPLPDRADERKSIPVEERFIDVDVNLRHTVVSFWGNNWKWFLGGSPVLAVLGWLGKKVKDKNAPKPL